MNRLCCLLLLLFFQLSLHAGQDRYELETAYFHDEQNQLTFESAQAQTFTPYQGQLRLGFTGGETWIRIRLKDNQPSSLAAPTTPLVLRVAPYSLDALVFHQKNAGHWTEQLGGEMQLQKKKVCIERQHCFEFDASNTDANFAYLKVQATSVRIVRTEVMTADDVLKSSIEAIKSVNTALNLSIALLILSIAFFFSNDLGCCWPLWVFNCPLCCRFALFQASSLRAGRSCQRLNPIPWLDLPWS